MKHTKVKAQPRNNTPHGKVRRGLRSNTVVKASQSGLLGKAVVAVWTDRPRMRCACGVYQRGAVSPYSTAGNRRDETASIAIVEMTDVHCRCANSNPGFRAAGHPHQAPHSLRPIDLAFQSGNWVGGIGFKSGGSVRAARARALRHLQRMPGTTFNARPSMSFFGSERGRHDAVICCACESFVHCDAR